MTPEFSIIIPTLNEVETLPRLLADLAVQSGVKLEVLISDGGSSDGTREVARAAMVQFNLDGQILAGEPGRGRQLNRGAAHSRGEWLLFLHADSRISCQTAMADALVCLRQDQNPRQAGRFTLQFDIPSAERDFGYYLCEVKARLDLPGTIHGDQGMLLTRMLFAELGGFREDLPVLEDTLLAERIRSAGRWRLLPATIVTSTRRFRAEGFAVRQGINALLMNFAMIGWDAPIRRAPDAYHPQDRTRPLAMAPFLRLVDACLEELPIGERVRIWYHTGRYVHSNAWQLALQRQARRVFAAGLPPAAVSLEPVLRFRRRFDAVTDHPVGHLVAALLTWFWFRTRSRSVRGG